MLGIKATEAREMQVCLLFLGNGSVLLIGQACARVCVCLMSENVVMQCSGNCGWLWSVAEVHVKGPP